MIEAIISGIGIGLVLTFLTGPVFFALIKTSIEKGFHAGVALALGVVTSDIVFVGAILFGSQFFDVTPETKTIGGIIGSAILFGIGIHYIFKKSEVDFSSHTPKRIKKAGFFFKGFVMCIFNPTILFHWITVIGTASTIYHQGIPNRGLKLGVMFLTVLIVQFGMDTTKAFYANKLRARISPKFVHRLNEVAGGALILASLILVDKLFTHFIFAK
ncbi:threonine/homoserine/homoserine lactone efflux protein [Mucilaginibacter yixingensis]|uniref:Threonine/homoserine/homoserine lactone efflux protein n=1 Tax=Mucilaginibacter yixingensis TaxID=1295612 RepID=A0A2T5JEZ2_9SPHI|nr:LysE family transporter [Mucilaginibacter yixingensis]PTR01007.1 threonine/homoserine/homoserine lactone efflux protein [Mucilaginibacter yixingensis]